MNRLKYLFQRLLMGIPVVLFGLTMTFLILYLGPLDPVTAILGRDSDPQTARRVAIDLGLRYPDGSKVPLWDQYVRFMIDMLTFDFGQSWVISRNTPVLELIANRAPATLWLGFWTIVVAICVGVPLGIYAGLNSNSPGDYLVSAGGISWSAMPNFWLAVILSGLLSTGFLSFYPHLGPNTIVIGTPDALGHVFTGVSPFEAVPVLDALWIPLPNPVPFFKSFKWILPAALVLGSALMGNEIRVGRTAVLENLNSKYVETARAKGVPERQIVWKHVGRNALVGLLPVIMGEFYYLVGGSVLVEEIFGINGMGSLLLSAAFQTDVPVIGAVMFFFIVVLVLFNTIQDLLYTFIDPRIEYSGEG